MWRAPIFEEDDLPTSPLAPDHFEKALMSSLVPCFGNEQGHCARSNVEHPMDNPSSVIAGNRNARLLSDMTIATVERRCLRDNSFIQHEQNRPLTSEKAVF